jgi:hypothetical protein
MVKLFLQSIDLSAPQKIERDLTTLENNVNAFIKQASVQPIATNFEVVEFAGIRYCSILLDYNLLRT